MYLFRSQYLYPVYRDCSTTFDLCPLLCCFNVQSVTLSCSFWTSACFPAASTSNPTRFLYSFWTSAMLPRSFNVQSVTLSCSFWTSACFSAALTSNPPRFLAHFGLLPCLPQLQRPIHHGFLLLLDFCLLPHSFNVQSTTLSCSFWTSTMPPAASTSNPPRFLAPFGLLPASPPPKSPIHHASNPPRIQATTRPIHHAPSHACLPTSYPQRKKATPAHQCQHCFISFNSLLIRLFNLITIPLFFSFP